MTPDSQVTVHFAESDAYPDRAPYHPPEAYPEYRGDQLDPNNHVYAAVRATLRAHGLDREHSGTPEWSPFRDLIKPGMTVFLKPNTVSHVNLGGHDLFAVIVHASVIRPMLDYICLALAGEGRIIIGDSQVIFAEFDPAMKASGIASLLEWYRRETKIPIECFDLRKERGARSWMLGRWARPKVEKDPRGYQLVDLGKDSYFEGIDPLKLRIAIASYKNMRKYHAAGKHQYVIPRSFLASDVVINIPKLKTHRRTAVTMCLKNYMGIPALKDCLPHFIVGAPSQGGDQYINPSRRKETVLWLHDRIQSNPYMPVKFFFAVIKRILWDSRLIIPFKDGIYEAMWPGNDTLWRVVLDLNRIVMYADKNGRLRDSPQRGQFHLIDGIAGGDGDGPVANDRVAARVLLTGQTSACVDAVGATLMGFDVGKIPVIYRAFADSSHKSPVTTVAYDSIRIGVGEREMTLGEFGQEYHLGFAPHPNWLGSVERPRLPPTGRTA
jgi:uncharacterized protein (DUF362 family)